MATATDQADLLTQAYRKNQIAQGARVAALVALYYRTRVQFDDPASVQKWLDLVLPRIIGGRNTVAREATAYATLLRRLEVPGASPFTFTPTLADDGIREAVTKSLLIVGPGDWANKAKQIETLDVPDSTRAAMLQEAKQVSADKLVGATLRHVQNGGRQTLADASDQDKTALGYVRVTSEKPCFFCAMLASRGLVFAHDSFEISDFRFTGDGTAKVHDNCSCSIKPVYVRKTDKSLKATEQFSTMWDKWGHGQGSDSVKLFRKGYDIWLKTGEVVDLATFA